MTKVILEMTVDKKMESVVRSIEKEMRIARNKGEVFGYKAIVLNDGEYKKIKSRPQK